MGFVPRPGETGLLLLFDDAVRHLRKGAPPPGLPPTVSQIYCLGYPTMVPAESTLAEAARCFGVPVLAWPRGLSEDEIGRVFVQMLGRSREADALAPQGASVPWPRLKANDRVYYRMAPLGKIEALLDHALTSGLGSRLLVPWLANRFDLVERSGMLALDAPGHQVIPTFERLSARHSVSVDQLWQKRRNWETVRIAVAETAMSLARVVALGVRALRDSITSRPGAQASEPSGQQPSVGYVVWGSSQWESLRPMIDAGEDRFRNIVISADIFRHPTAYKTLRRSKRPFVPIDSVLGVCRTVRSLWRSTLTRRRLVGALRQGARDATDVQEQEKLMLLAADLASLPELELYVVQLREAIRRFGLRALISANNVDSFLGATTVAAHAEGIPHVCIHNTAFERVQFPVYADCDLYVADSESYAQFLRDSGAVGAVEALGLPSYDDLIHSARRAQAGAVFRAYPHLAGKRIVGVTTQTAWIDFAPLISALADWAEGRKDVAVVVKLHPRENPNAYADLIARLEASGRGGSVHHVNLADFLSDCACLVAGGSTTLFWAILLGVRPFSWAERNIQLMAVGLDYLRPEITEAAEDPRTLVVLLSRALDDPLEAARWRQRRELFIERYLTGADGRACARIFARLGELARLEPDLHGSHSGVGG